MSLLPVGADALVPGIIVSHRPDADIQQEEFSKSTKINKTENILSFSIVIRPICERVPHEPLNEIVTVADLRTRLDIACRIAVEASPVALQRFRSALDVSSKSDQSPVTIADQDTERAIRSALEAAFRGETIFGEEFGQTGTQDDMWIVDPIDGTRSFITGLPLFGMLLGYVADSAPQLGVINMPALGELYAGARGIGATMNGSPIHVSDCRSLSSARLFLNEADKMAVDVPAQLSRMVSAGAIRRLGADCYPHALVASGHVDAVVDYGLQPYDYMPVAAVVEAAGGVMTDWQGNTLSLTSDGRTLTAATPDLHAELLELVRP